MGIYPESAAGLSEDYLSQTEEWSDAPKMVAIEEVGLNYHCENMASRGVQRKVLEDQTLPTKHRNLPIVVCDRKAHGDTTEILRRYRPRGVACCFPGSAEVMREVAKFGIYINLGDVVTSKNARVAVEAAREIPLNRPLTETDAPYLVSEPFRGKWCDPSIIRYIVQCTTEIRGITADEVLVAGRRNAETLFDIIARGQCDLTITYVVEKDHLYINITNRCPNARGFRVRPFNGQKESGVDFWLEHEPTCEEILERLKSRDLDSYRELISCGYGESACRFNDLVWLCQQVRQMSCVNIRLSTSSLSDLINRRSTAPGLNGLLDSASTSFNAFTSEKYQEICHSRFGLEVPPAILKFIKTAGSYVLKVYMMVVGNTPCEEISICEKLCHEAGATSRMHELLDHQLYVEK